MSPRALRLYHRDQATEYARAAVAFRMLAHRHPSAAQDIRDDWLRSAAECERLAAVNQRAQ